MLWRKRYLGFSEWRVMYWEFSLSCTRQFIGIVLARMGKGRTVRTFMLVTGISTICFLYHTGIFLFFFFFFRGGGISLVGLGHLFDRHLELWMDGMPFRHSGSAGDGLFQILGSLAGGSRSTSVLFLCTITLKFLYTGRPNGICSININC